MDWKKAVNYTIIFLLIVNAVLLCLNVYKRKDTTVGQERYNALTSLLTKNNVALDCPLPTNYPPMQQLEVENYSFDVLKLRDAFFESTKEVIRTDDGDKSVFSDAKGTLTIGKSEVTFDDNNGEAVSDSIEAQSKAEIYVNKINALFGKYGYSNTLTTNEGIMVCYYERIDSYSLFNNYFKVLFKKTGGITVSFSYRTIVGKSNDKNDIMAADEAVFALVNTEDTNEKRTVTDVSLGFYNPNPLGEDNTVPPFYKIVVNNREYFVNAYSGKTEE